MLHARPLWNTLARWFAMALLFASGIGFVGAGHARESRSTWTDSVSVTSLPAEALRTLNLVKHGGPFPYPKDGIVFSNREKRLPRQPRGYYTEYTVKTPGSHDRGARRIVAGGDPQRSGEYYYTDDHYQSFKRIQD